MQLRGDRANRIKLSGTRYDWLTVLAVIRLIELLCGHLVSRILKLEPVIEGRADAADGSSLRSGKLRVIQRV